MTLRWVMMLWGWRGVSGGLSLAGQGRGTENSTTDDSSDICQPPGQREGGMKACMFTEIGQKEPTNLIFLQSERENL